MLLLSPPGYEVLALIPLTHLFIVSPVGSTPGRPCFQGWAGASPQTSGHVGISRASLSNDLHSRRPGRKLLCAPWHESTWWERLVFLNPQAPIFFASPDSTPKRNLSQLHNGLSHYSVSMWNCAKKWQGKQQGREWTISPERILLSLSR